MAYTSEQLSGYGTNQLPFQSLYETSLSRWLAQQAESKKAYGTAAKPLTEAAALFAPGGGYGAGQRAIIEEEAKKAGAAGMAGLVASGMSSGTAVTGMGARLAGDVTRAKLGVEDVRMTNLTELLSKLSALKTAYAGQLGTVTEPTYSPYMGTIGGLEQTAMRIGGERAISSAQIAAQQRMQQEELASRERMANLQPKQEQALSLHL